MTFDGSQGDLKSPMRPRELFRGSRGSRGRGGAGVPRGSRGDVYGIPSGHRVGLMRLLMIHKAFGNGFFHSQISGSR